MIKFGTSGYRGVMGDTFTKESVQKLAYAILKVIEEDNIKNAKVVIGYDNRFMSKNFSEWMSEVLSSKVKVRLFNTSSPSPMICYFSKKYTFGVVVTASHNPYIYNGIKLFYKRKEADDILAKRIEDYANNASLPQIATMPFELAVKTKQIIIESGYKEYCDSMMEFLDIKSIKKRNLKLLINPMHGNSVESLTYLLRKLNIKDHKFINENIDPYFENKIPAPYSQNLQEMAQEVKRGGYDLGLALDGDSDRFSLISSQGKFYDCNFVIAVLYYFYVTQGMKGGVVKNYALSTLISKVAEHFGREYIEVRNGFKHVAIAMESSNAFIGGETNGVAFKNHIMSKDGIFACLQIIDALSCLNQSFEDILKEVQQITHFKSQVVEYAYPVGKAKKEEIIKNIFDNKSRPDFLELEQIGIFDDEGLKIIYSGGYWGMIRFSGNEPVVRIFSEMKDIRQCGRMIKCYEQFLGIKVRQE